MAALLDGVPHCIDEDTSGDYPPGREPCAERCIRCAWERMKKEKE